VRSPAKIKPLYNFSLNKWYVDDIYDVVFVQGSRKLAKQVLEIDVRIVDGLVNLAGFVTLITGEGLKYLENGRAQFYALIVFGAVLGLCCFRASPDDGVWVGLIGGEF
jgi:NAD(P)H-quinone oxidoreductase subunit 5